jgi:2-polyprenyl-3-methyl-5-hydroxy-6-metoxy-1,4-benzoquinol methylase
MTNTETWDRIAVRDRSTGAAVGDVVYGPGAPTERDLRLVGPVAGKRVLDLGCGAGQAAISLATRGATAIGVDASSAQLGLAKARAEREEVRVEWHQGDLADLAFLGADSIDLVFSAHALGEVHDLARVFRQVHRVLKPRGAFVFSVEHPIALCTARDAPAPGTVPASGALPLGRLVVHRSSFDRSAITVERQGEPVTLYQRSVSDVFMALGRAGFRVEVILEPEPIGTETKPLVPATIIWRARKEGV